MINSELETVCKIIKRASNKELIDILDNIPFLDNQYLYGLLSDRMENDSWDDVKKIRGIK